RSSSQVQMNEDSGKHNVLVHADLEPLAAHADEYLLVGFHVFRGEVPMTHGHADLVEGEWLRGRVSCDQTRGEPQCSEQLLHESLPLGPVLSFVADLRYVNAITSRECAKARPPTRKADKVRGPTRRKTHAFPIPPDPARRARRHCVRRRSIRRG